MPVIRICCFSVRRMEHAESGHARESDAGLADTLTARVPEVGSLARCEVAHPAMGTFFSVVAYGPDAACLDDAMARAFKEVDRLEDLMSHYRRASELCRINREAHDRPVTTTAEMFGLLNDAQRYSEETEGAFDITIGPLMKAWGFFKGWGRMPDQSELDVAMRGIGYQHVKLNAEAGTVWLDAPGIELNLGAIGKGYAVDRIVEILRAAGIERALVSSGTSSIYALGAPPDEEGWTISVCHPFDRRRTACVVVLKDLSLSVSGDCEKCFELGGKTYAHIMDPRTGRPAEDMVMAVAIAPTVTESDALSTAFFVGGVEGTRLTLERHPNVRALLYVPQRSSHTFEQIALESRVKTLGEDRVARF